MTTARGTEKSSVDCFSSETRRNFYPRHWLRRRRRRHGRERVKVGGASRRERTLGRLGDEEETEGRRSAKRMAVGREIKETIGFTTTTKAKAFTVWKSPTFHSPLVLCCSPEFLLPPFVFPLFLHFLSLPLPVYAVGGRLTTKAPPRSYILGPGI